MKSNQLTKTNYELAQANIGHAAKTRERVSDVRVTPEGILAVAQLEVSVAQVQATLALVDAINRLAMKGNPS